MAPIDARQTVGHIAALVPASIPVFERHGIDFCCGGARPLDEACAQLELSADDVLAEIRSARPANAAGAPDVDWTTAPIAALVEHIERTHHRPLDSELPHLADLVETVARVHGPHHPEQMQALKRVWYRLRDELEPHMRKEEAVLFPWLQRGGGLTAGATVKMLTEEHERVGALLTELERLTDHFRTPDDACSTWRYLWDGLHALDHDLRTHIHLENNVLFPRALA